MFVGLVKDPGSGWRPPDDLPEPAGEPHAWNIQIPWRALLWIALFVALFTASDVVGGVAGYGLMLAAIALGGWRLDRCFSGQWTGLRDYQS